MIREDAFFRDVLAACDDLAWECYGPAAQRFNAEHKQPPLVYFTSTWSPFAFSRDSNFQNEVRAGAGARGMLGEDALQEVLRRLPIPLIGVPWYQAFHLPGALIIAHEAGHIVEFDFGLTGEIETALDRAGLAQNDRWKEWASEVFADLYGCLRAGPVFVGAMMNLLATSVAAIQREKPRSGRYPTRALRVELMLQALDRLGHANENRRLRATWENTYGAMQTMPEFKSDVPKVVMAIYAGTYRGIALTELGSFPTDAADAVRVIAQRAAGNDWQKLAEEKDPAKLFAAAQWLHENQHPKQREAYKLLTRQIVEKGRSQFRMRGKPASQETIETDLGAHKEADRRGGRELRDFVLTLAACPRLAADRRIAQDHEVAGIVARHPQVSQLLERNIDPVLQVGLHFGDLDGDRGPAQVEHISGLADALATKQPSEHVAKALDLGAAALTLERIRPGALDMRQHRQCAAIAVCQHLLRQLGEKRRRRDPPRSIAQSVVIV